MMKNIDNMLENQSKVLKGTLRITSADYIGRKFLFPIIEQICDKHPDITIDLQLNDEQVNIIKDRYDLAIRVWEPQDANLIAQKLANIHILLVASPDFIKQFGTPKTLDELKKLPSITYSRKGYKHRTLNYIDKDNKLSSFNLSSNLSINDVEVMNHCINKGNRYFVTANYVAAEKIKSGELVQLLPDIKFTYDEDIFAVYPTRSLSLIARLIIQELKKELARCQLDP